MPYWDLSYFGELDAPQSRVNGFLETTEYSLHLSTNGGLDF